MPIFVLRKMFEIDSLHERYQENKAWESNHYGKVDIVVTSAGHDTF